MKKFKFLLFASFFSVSLGAQNSLLISEVLFQPVSGEAEFVELYNPSSSPISLSDFHIVRVLADTLGRHYPLPSFLVPPHDYVVLTKNASSILSCFDVLFPSKIVECSLPAYPNSGGSVVLSLADSSVVDRLDYSPSMHSRLLRNKKGVSLERRSFSAPTNVPSNWYSASSTSRYATPTVPNSQSTEFLVEESAFVLSSSTLSPDGDDFEDVLTLEYGLPESGLMGRLEVFDAHGRRVRKLLDNALLGTSGSVVWDGLDDAHRLLPTGQYILLLTVYDVEGQRQLIKRAVGYLMSNR